MGATLVLVACGGGGGGTTPNTGPTTSPAPTQAQTPSFSVGGGIVGLLNGTGLTLVNGYETLPIAANATTFAFVTKVAQNSTYNVSVGSQPAGMACTVSNASGTMALAEVQSIAVNCAPVARNNLFTVSTFAGDDGQILVDGVGAAVRFGTPYAIVSDNIGNMYVSDPSSDAIRKVSSSGLVTTFSINSTTGLGDGQNIATRLSGPSGMAMDPSGNLYVANTGHHGILKIPPSGVVNLLAGHNQGGAGFTDGDARDARFNRPKGVAVDNTGNVYVADTGNNAIRKITPAGVVSTLAGDAQSGLVDGLGSAARFREPSQLTIDSAGNLLVADTANRSIRKVTPSGVVTTVVGQGQFSYGFVDGVGSAARFGELEAIAIDNSDNLYVVDRGNNAIRKVTPSAVVTTLAGGIYGFADGGAAAARFSKPTGILLDSLGNLRVVDQTNRAIRTVSPSGLVTTLAGQGPAESQIDGQGTGARFFRPRSVATDRFGNVYVADDQAVRKIAPNGAVSTLAGDSVNHNVDPTGAPATIVGPSLIAADDASNVYVVDIGVIRKLSPAGVITNLPKIDSPQGIAATGDGTLYITSKNSVIKMAPSGEVAVIAGSADGGFVDGPGGTARFSAPKGIAVDSGGNVYVADFNNGNAIRKISPQGQVTTLARGTFSGPLGIAVDGVGNVYVAGNAFAVSDRFGTSYVGGAVGKVADGVVTKIAGENDARVEGPGAIARFNNVTGIAADSNGNIYVADSGNASIRKIVP